MRRHKKLIVAAVLAAVLVAGSIGGIALAQENEEGGLKAKFGDFITKVCDIYDKNVDPDIDREALQAAIDDVRTQMAADRAEMRAGMGDRPEMDPEAMKEHLDAFLAEDKITQEQYDKIIERWESMPDDFTGFGFRGMGGLRGMGGMWGFGGPCAPTE